MTSVVLDSGALSALAASTAGTRVHRLQALLDATARRGGRALVPSAVLAELYRGNTTDARLDRILNRRGVGVITTGRHIARIAGGLRHRDRLDSCHVVDCLVVATAIALGGAVVATCDYADLIGLARSNANVVVLDI